MSIEGLGKKFQEARLARGLTLDEAARMTKIRPSRLAEIEADDFSNFPSLAYAKGFLLIYGKFLDVDVSEFMEAFENSAVRDRRSHHRARVFVHEIHPEHFARGAANQAATAAASNGSAGSDSYSNRHSESGSGGHTASRSVG